MTRLSINRPFVLVLVLELVLDWPTRFRGRARGRARGRSSSLSQCAPTDASGLAMRRRLADGSRTPGATGMLRVLCPLFLCALAIDGRRAESRPNILHCIAAAHSRRPL